MAIPEAVSRAGLEVGDVDIFELNEAFASQASYCIKVSHRGKTTRLERAPILLAVQHTKLKNV